MKNVPSLLEHAQPANISSFHLRNLRIIADAHEQMWPKLDQSDEIMLSHYAAKSGEANNQSVFIKRSGVTIADIYGLSIEALADYCRGGRVVDHGCGRSDFLSHFKKSETIAVDQVASSLFYQRLRRHLVVRSINDMNRIETGSVRLLNASWSLPFWARSIQHARDFADESVRILEPGGIALIGPIVSRDLLPKWEKYLSQRDTTPEPSPPWTDALTPAHSVVLAAFANRLTNRDILNQVAVRTLRIETNKSVAPVVPPKIQIPNYIALHKITQ